MRKLLLTVATLAFVAPAYAGCSTVGTDASLGPLTDAGATKAVVCLMNKCDKTIEITVCSFGPGGSLVTYGNGVTVKADAKGKTTGIVQGDKIVPRSQWKTLVIKTDPNA